MTADPIAPTAPTASVLRRRVYFISGVDPRGVRFYHQLYIAEAAAQAVVSGCAYDVGPWEKTGEHAAAWDVSARHADGTGATQTRYSFLSWDDLIRAQCPVSLRKALTLMPGFYWRYARDGGFSTAWVHGRRFFWVMLLPLIYLASCLLLMAAGGVLIASAVSWLVPGRWVGALAAAAGLSAWVGLGHLAVWGGDAMRLPWLVTAIAFVPRWGRTRPEALTRRWQAFAAQIHADLMYDAAQQPPQTADEVLVIGHCGGGLSAVCVADHLLTLPAVPGGPPVKLVTMGTVTALLGVVPQADWFRDQLVRVGNSAMPWKAFSAPSDPLCYALSDPFTACGLPRPHGHGGFQIKSSRFDLMFDQAAYASVRLDAFRIHFQYLMATQLPVDNDYFTLTAGPQPLTVQSGQTPPP